jgi:hypothetical protein
MLVIERDERSGGELDTLVPRESALERLLRAQDLYRPEKSDSLSDQDRENEERND